MVLSISVNKEKIIGIAILDNDVLAAKMLSHWIDQISREHHVTWVAHSGAEALHHCLFGNEIPDVLIADMALGDISGDIVCRKIRQKTPDIGLLCITAYETKRYEEDAISAGAQGILAKENLIQDLPSAIIRASHGLPIDDRFPDALTAHHLLNSKTDKRPPKLSRKEQEVLRLYAQDHSTEQISALLSISQNTVYTYIHRILKKMEVHNRKEAVILCRKYDLI